MEIDKLENWRRTHYSDQIDLETLKGKEIIVCGWIKQTRDLGGLKFAILRDNFGEVQITFPKAKLDEKLFEKANSLRNEMPVAFTFRSYIQSESRS
jgi:aspartyl-tRNA synthetase